MPIYTGFLLNSGHSCRIAMASSSRKPSKAKKLVKAEAEAVDFDETGAALRTLLTPLEACKVGNKFWSKVAILKPQECEPLKHYNRRLYKRKCKHWDDGCKAVVESNGR